MNTLRIKVLLFFFTIICSGSLAQERSLERVVKQFDQYGSTVDNSVLFVHFDKNVYINTEDVWFTAYLLNSATDFKLHHTLYISLVNRQDSSVVLQEKFLIKDGFSFGSLNLPDSLKNGNYLFIVNTNIKLNDKPEQVFIQPVTLKSNYLDPFELSLQLGKKTSSEGTVLVKAISKKYHFIEKAKITYSFGNELKSSIKGVGYTNTIGELLIKYPIDKIDSSNNVLKIVGLKENITRYASIGLPLATHEKVNQIIDKKVEKFSIKFYPEGGYLVKDLVSTIGIEARKDEDVLLKAKIVIFENGVAFDTVSTSVLGMGKFKLRPLTGFVYTAKLLYEGKLIGNYLLPEPLSKGCVLSMPSLTPDSVVSIYLQTKNIKNVTVVVHNSNKIFLAVKGALQENRMSLFKLSLLDVPTGLAIITILDSINRPIAERLFFAHQNKLNNLNIDLVKSEFSKRDSVKLKITATDFSGQLLGGLVSIASVHSTNLSSVNNLNILDYTYLDKQISDSPVNYSALKVRDLNYLEDLFLVKFWRKYKWNEEEISVPKKNIVSEIKYNGRLLNKDKALKKPEKYLFLNAKTLLKLGMTDSLGNFSLDYKLLIVDPYKNNFRLSVVLDEKEDYSFKLINPYQEVKKWASTLKYIDKPKESTLINSRNENSITAKAIKLKDVSITNVKGEFIFGCADFVCPFNILNCFNHFGDINNKRPKVGEQYLTKSQHPDVIIYKQCMGSIKGIDDIIGINPPKEYYTLNVTDLNEPVDFSTIYWNYQLKLNNKEAMPLSFNTGDLTGKFKIIVQGITDKGLVYGEKEFTVKK